MSALITYLYPILFSLLFGYYNGWQWKDEQDGVYDPKKAKTRWKAASVALRCLALFGFIIPAFVPVSWSELPLAACISLPVFDITINLTRGVPVFYLGTTSKTDRFGKWKWAGYAVFIIIALITKIHIQ
jgi:hypothetical protein